MGILPDETKLIGKWILDGKDVVEDGTCTRVRELINQHLKKIATFEDGWEMLYLDPEDGRYWELVYLNGEWQGGGPLSLFNLSEAEARKKYKF
jgi:hypothetical protein